ncbi:MAG: YdcF family protein [Bradyrhizobium sp.]|nr:YdcF family protein [Bradyrhizobium sp.]
MFFALSKTLGVMALPTNLLLGLGLLGVLLCATRWARFGRRLLVTIMLLLAICGFSPLGNVLLYPLESRFPPWNPAGGPPDGIIVLGGPIDPDLSVEHGTPVIHSAPDRIVAGAALALKYPDARLVFTGGSPNLIANDVREADYAAAVFESLGIARSRLMVERRSRNTHENAEFTRDMVLPKPGERWLLVTSAFHMPRAIGLFRKAGFAVQPYPVDWRVGRKWSEILEFSPIADDGLGRTDLALREWMGLTAYRLTGRTDALLPGSAVE